jgi:hypothetical protein
MAVDDRDATFRRFLLQGAMPYARAVSSIGTDLVPGTLGRPLNVRRTRLANFTAANFLRTLACYQRSSYPPSYPLSYPQSTRRRRKTAPTSEAPLPGRPSSFVETLNCTDPTQPLNACGVGVSLTPRPP